MQDNDLRLRFENDFEICYFYRILWHLVKGIIGMDFKKNEGLIISQNECKFVLEKHKEKKKIYDKI